MGGHGCPPVLGMDASSRAGMPASSLEGTRNEPPTRSENGGARFGDPTRGQGCPPEPRLSRGEAPTKPR